MFQLVKSLYLPLSPSLSLRYAVGRMPVTESCTVRLLRLPLTKKSCSVNLSRLSVIKKRCSVRLSRQLMATIAQKLSKQGSDSEAMGVPNQIKHCLHI